MVRKPSKRRKTPDSKESIKARPSIKKNTSLLHPLTPRTAGQKIYLDTIASKPVTICEGPAGTGKTFISFGSALKLYLDSDSAINRIVIARPTLPAGDEPELGFLPGTLNEKMEPFMAPILRDSVPLLIKKPPRTAVGHGYGTPDSRGQQDMSSMLLKFNIEIVPLHLMRGRTFHNAFVILDEAQNCSMEDFKLFITRLGKDSKAVIEGDASQKDRKNGSLLKLMGKLKGLDCVGLVKLSQEDIIRNPIISEILQKLK